MRTDKSRALWQNRTASVVKAIRGLLETSGLNEGLVSLPLTFSCREITSVCGLPSGTVARVGRYCSLDLPPNIKYVGGRFVVQSVDALSQFVSSRKAVVERFEFGMKKAFEGTGIEVVVESDDAGGR